MPEPDLFWRRSNLGYRMFAANDRFIREKLDAVRASGFVGISDALLTLFVSIDPHGTRVSDIALRAGLTKQSVVELIDRAEKLDFAERSVDPDDRRARIVRFTPHGEALSARLRAALTEAEQGLIASAGPDFVAVFKARFGAYSAMPVGDASVVGEADGSRDQAEWRSGNAGRVLALASRRFAREALSRVQVHGYREVGEGLLALFRNLDLGGTRLTELAARAHMTKQSMRELADRAEALGFIARFTDAVDRRAKVITFTEPGRVLLGALGNGVAQAEVETGRIVGAKFLAETKTRLAAYAGSPTR